MKHAFGLTAVAGLAAALAFGGAAAHEKDFVFIDKDIRVHKHRDFQSIDQDGDGKISREEFLADPAGHFDELDADKDGYLDPDEREAVFDRKFAHLKDFERERWESLIERFDADGDEMLAIDEILSKTEEKVAEAMKRVRERDGTWTHSFEGPFDFGGPLAWHFGRGPLVIPGERALERYDRDGDNEVSEQEFLAAQSEKFKKLDADGDGKLSKSELEDFAWGGAFAFKYRDGADDED